MIVINFSHPLTEPQITQIEDLVGRSITEIRNVSIMLDQSVPFAEQVRQIVDDTGMYLHEWQASQILINPPAYGPFATILVAELHGRMGHFPVIIRIRPVASSFPNQYEICEIVDLQAVRYRARENR